MPKKINIVTLGCSKNVVDSEKLMGQLDANGFELHHDSNDHSDIVIINTCGFINDAKQESIDTILNFAQAKERGDIEKLFVIGCLSERYADELRSEINDVDEYFGCNDITKILNAVDGEFKRELISDRIQTTPRHLAYLKIAEGCNRSCSFCAIPLIRGKFVSEPVERLLCEAEKLTASGVKEIMLIAQDLSFYGNDLYKDTRLPHLVEKLAMVNGLDWLRLHYLYPMGFPDELTAIIKNHNNVCNYIDMPVQHISDNMLKIMRRGIGKKGSYELLEKIKRDIPDISLRTTLLVGHPGETEQDFNELLSFVEDFQFDRLGVFTYSHEEDTHSHKMDNSIPDAVKQERADEIMALQQDISYKKNQEKIGKTFKTIIDRQEGDVFVGRTEADSYEIDNEVIINAEKATLGEFYEVEIYDAADYDLYGKIK